ncbi:MAG: N-acetylglucosamine-6-phosphate deacetylase [Pseudomonadota bacterium]
MSAQVYHAAQLFSGTQLLDDVHLFVEDGVVTALRHDAAGLEPAERGAVIGLSGLIAPGFIDVQVNGAAERLFNAQPDLLTLQTMLTTHQRFGTTAMLPTLISDRFEIMQRAADAVAEGIRAGLPGLIGVHFEGPHLARPKRGIHPTECLRGLTEQELDLYARADIGQVVVTVAPENVGVDVIGELVRRGVIVCLGHSEADLELVEAALAAGATGFTHLFNAMSGLQGRTPGLVGAALSHRESYAGLIADLHHVHPRNCELAVRIKGVDRIMLVTDAMHHVGSDAQTLNYFDTVIYRDGDKLTLADGALAGSALDMASAVRNCCSRIGLELASALMMASRTPAAFLGRPDLGGLAVGQRADFVQLGDQLRVQGTWVAGRKC